MGKTSKWLKSFLTGKKDKEKEICTSNQNSSNATENPTTPLMILPTTPKEKRRWSFRRSSATAAAAPWDLNSTEPAAPTQPAMQAPTVNNEDKQRKHALAVAAATAAAADAAVAAAQAAAAVIRLTAAATGRISAIEEAAAIKIQSVFRAYLARKALCALKGLVKLQALVRGHLVRKQATATLRRMQALVTVQARALAQRIQMTAEKPPVSHRQSVHRKSTQENRFRYAYPEIDRGLEENIKIVEMDHGESKGCSKGKNSYSSHPVTETVEHRFSAHYASHHAYAKQDNYEVSLGPSASALTDMSPRACSGHFEEYSYGTAQSSPQYYSVSKPDPSRVPFELPRPNYAESLSYDYLLYPNYMANTESSRAKVRSQSAPKLRPDSFERQPNRRRGSMEGRNIPRAVRMQRSSSHFGAAAQNIQYPWSMKLDRSTVSLKDSECGSTTSTMLTSTNYCRSLFAYDHHGNRY